MTPKKRATSRGRLSCFLVYGNIPELIIFHLSFEKCRNASILKTNRMNDLNTFYQHLHATPVTLHNAIFLLYCKFCIFLDLKP